METLNIEKLFYKPGAEYQYISNDLLDRALDEPFPIDLKNEGKGSIILGNYFLVEPSSINGIKTKGITSKKLYHNTTTDERNLVFITLCNFMECYRKPYISCLLKVASHPSVEKNPEFLPLIANYGVAQYPSINNAENYLRIRFCESYFIEVYEYIFGESPQIPLASKVFCFPFSTFYGFVIQP